MKIKNWARVGALTNQNSDLLILGDASKSAEFYGCYTEGVVSSTGCTVIANYTKSNGNSGDGFLADAGGVILGTQLTENGNTHGLFAYQGGLIACNDGIDFSSQTNNNTQYGIYANGGRIKSTNVKARGNKLSNVNAIYNSDVNLRGTSSRKSVLTNSAAGVIAATGSHVDLFRAEINTITGIGINVSNATAEIGNTVVTACSGGEFFAENGASVVGDLVHLAGSGAGHATVKYGSGASVNLPHATVIATGANSRAVEGSGGMPALLVAGSMGRLNPMATLGIYPTLPFLSHETLQFLVGNRHWLIQQEHETAMPTCKWGIQQPV